MNIMGYETKTTFWDDFAIADAFGKGAIKDTFNRAFNEWKGNYEYLTELVMVLNWRGWIHYDEGNEEIAKLYFDFWGKADEYAISHLKGEELSYFYRTTD